MADYDRFAQAVRWVDEVEADKESIRKVLLSLGPELIRALMDGTERKSLRSVARQTGYSPTYLWQVIHGRRPIGAPAFCKLTAILRESDSKGCGS